MGSPQDIVYQGRIAMYVVFPPHVLKKELKG